MEPKFLRWLGIVIILEIGLLHIMTAQGEYEEAAYLGYLFAANFFGALVAAFGIYHKQFWGWALGLFIAVGSVVGYGWSRTFGMPGMETEEWIVPYGVISLSVEFAFMLLFLFRPWKMTDDASLVFPNSLITGGALFLIVISVFTYRWDASVMQAYGQHVVSLEQVLDSPELSSAQLEEEYGVQVALAATSMMNSVVDVRLKIVDPDKAHTLLKNQAALLVSQDELVLAPHMHSHNTTRLKPGKVFVIFFPTEQIISTGSKVSLVFGSVRIEPVVVQ